MTKFYFVLFYSPLSRCLRIIRRRQTTQFWRIASDFVIELQRRSQPLVILQNEIHDAIDYHHVPVAKVQILYLTTHRLVV